MTKKKLVLLISSGVAVLVLIIVGIFIWKHVAKAPTVRMDNNLPVSKDTTPTQPTQPINPYPTTMTPSQTDYHLIKGTVSDDPSTLKTTYYEDGTVPSGSLVGYHLIIADTNSEQYDYPGSSGGTLLFATKDYKTFLVDSTGWKNGPDFFGSNVTGAADIQTNHPAVINYNGLVYDRGAYYGDGKDTTIKIPAAAKPLEPSVVSGLQFYASEPTTSSFVPSDTKDYEQNDLDVLNTKQKYFAMDSTVYAVDKFGVIFTYTLEAPQINSSDTSVSTYNTYSKLLPTGCALGPLYTLQNVSDKDIKPLTSSLSGLKLYTLSDVNHPLNQAEYKAKIGVYSESAWKGFYPNDSNILPTYKDYVSKNPILIYKDAWGRFIGVGEYDNYLPGGCGKPVIYLYPKTQTKVTISLADKTYFNTDIPRYTNSWQVSASPSGALKDLQPQYTKCDSIDFTKVGSEYAKQACASGIYPYIYWSGTTENSFLPKNDTGWIVSKDDLKNFLPAKMSAMGFNTKETNDMVSYWLPEMLSKNQPYYQVSFYQTADMNKYIPMNISPKPDTELRMFMNWSALSQKPATPLAPEQLSHVQRKGFTLVEWGGLKQ